MNHFEEQTREFWKHQHEKTIGAKMERSQPPKEFLEQMKILGLDKNPEAKEEVKEEPEIDYEKDLDEIEKAQKLLEAQRKAFWGDEDPKYWRRIAQEKLPKV